MPRMCEVDKGTFVVHMVGDDELYAYRPREVLVANGHPVVAQHLVERGATACDELGGGAYVRWLLPEADRTAVHDVVVELQAQVDASPLGLPVVAPHYVMAPAGHMLMGPAYPPVPAGARTALPPADDAPGQGLRIGIVDTGLVPHPWLAGRIDPRSEPENVPAPLAKTSGHGTFVAGVVLLHAPGAEIEVVSALAADGEMDDESVAKAILRLHAPDIVCLSLGSYGHLNVPPPLTFVALQQLKLALDAPLVVACVGNDERSDKFYPAAWDDVIAVASVDAMTSPSSFTNWGAWVDACARGEGVHSSYVTGTDGTNSFAGWARWTGTSFAAPRVAGILAAWGEKPSEAADALVFDPACEKREKWGTRLALVDGGEVV